MPNYKRIANNTLFLYFRMLLIMGVNLYISRVLLRVLGVEDYGLYNVVGGIVSMFSFLNGSLGGATSRFITFELGRNDFTKLNAIFNVALLTHIALAIIIIILAETIGLWFFYEKMIIPEPRLIASFWVYQISILTCFFTLTQVPYDALIIAHENMKIYAYVSIVEVLLKLGVVYLLLISPIDRLIFYAILLFIVRIAVMVFYRCYCTRYKESKLKLCLNKAFYKNMFSYAGSDLIGSAAALAQGQGLNLLLNVFFGPVVNAARAIAYQIQGAVTQFSNNFFTAVRPQIIKSYAEGNISGMMQLVKYSSWFSFYLLLILILPISFEINYILKLWLGEYPEHTVNFVKLVLVLCLIQSLKTPRTTVFHATGKLFLTNIVVGSIMCAVFPLAYCCLKLNFPPESVFVCANITMIIAEVASTFILRKYVKFSVLNYFLQVHCRCLLVVFLAIPILYFIHSLIPTDSIRLIIMIVASLAIISVLAITLGIDNNSRNVFISYLKRRFK